MPMQFDLPAGCEQAKRECLPNDEQCPACIARQDTGPVQLPLAEFRRDADGVLLCVNRRSAGHDASFAAFAAVQQPTEQGAHLRGIAGVFGPAVANGRAAA